MIRIATKERVRARCVAGCLLLAACSIAGAHDLAVFATVDDGLVRGYAFFGGGGRASRARLLIRDGAGNELFRGGTDVEGAFNFRPGVPTELIVTVDVGDGHAAKTRIPADRFAAADTIKAVPAVNVQAGRATPNAAAANDVELSEAIERSVDRAVARQVTPLLEAYATADHRLRLSDMLGGVALIIGLAGMFLWGQSRRTPRTGRARDAI